MKPIILVGLLVIAFAGCGDDVDFAPDRYLVEYQIGMHSMAVDPVVDASAPLVVRLTGVIGPSTRYDYNRAVVSETDSTYELTLYGLRNDDPNALHLNVLVEWQGYPFTKQPPHADSVRFVVHQPGGGVLEETVVVRP
jgi:hypothetical protein